MLHKRWRPLHLVIPSCRNHIDNTNVFFFQKPTPQQKQLVWYISDKYVYRKGELKTLSLCSHDRPGGGSRKPPDAINL